MRYTLKTIWKDHYKQGSWLFQVIPEHGNEAEIMYLGVQVAMTIDQAGNLLYPDQRLQKGAKRIFGIVSGTYQHKAADFESYR
jgi:hypothetical protein